MAARFRLFDPHDLLGHIQREIGKHRAENGKDGEKGNILDAGAAPGFQEIFFVDDDGGDDGQGF